MADSWVHEVLCRQRHELWPRVYYMKLCVDTDLNRFLTAVYKDLHVDRDLNCGRYLVVPS